MDSDSTCYDVHSHELCKKGFCFSRQHPSETRAAPITQRYAEHTHSSKKDAPSQLSGGRAFETCCITEARSLKAASQLYLSGGTLRKILMGNSWFARDVTKILKSKPGGLQNFYLLLMKDYLKIYLFTIP